MSTYLGEFMDYTALINYTAKLQEVFLQGDSFSIELLAENWENMHQTIISQKFNSNSNYSYVIVPNYESIEEYIRCGIYAQDISVDGQMTFSSKKEPQSNLTANIILVITGGKSNG